MRSAGRSGGGRRADRGLTRGVAALALRGRRGREAGAAAAGGETRLRLRRGDQALADCGLASLLAGPADGLGLLASLAHGRLLISLALLHLAEDALALHLLLEDAKRLIDVVVANE